MSQCQKPSGWMGKIVLWSMNRRHSSLTDWGLGHVRIGSSDVILDVGCGGGRTVDKLARAAPQGKVYGVDHAEQSVVASRAFNRQWLERGTVEIRRASVTELPFPDATFDLVTAIETHFWWADLAGGMREIRRVLKPGGRLVIIAEFYNGGRHAKYAERISRYTTMAVLSVEEHRRMFSEAGFDDIRLSEDEAKGWICVVGGKPSAAPVTPTAAARS